MKTLHADQIDLIDAFVAESSASLITPALLEKDIHVTDALLSLMSLQHDGLQLVFCGGTNLSKAYGLIERMSEDIDLKVVLTQPGTLSRSAIARRLSLLKQQVATTLATLGLVEDSKHRIARSENRYFGMRWLYEPAYEVHGSLRPYLSIELTTRIPNYPIEKRPIGYLLNTLLARPPIQNVACVSDAETLSEKVVSFLRRYAQNRAGKMRQPWDTALVRHIYDVHCIHQLNPTCVELAKMHFAKLVTDDVAEFGNQFEVFAEAPRATLLQALTSAASDKSCKDEYERYLLPLIFGETRPNYDEAFGSFKHCATALIQELDYSFP